MAHSTPRRRHHALRFILMAAFLSAPTVAFGITELRLDCEQQAKRLSRCCGTSRRTGPNGGRTQLLQCVEDDGCAGLVDVVDRGTLDCLEDLSCEQVLQLGLCDDPAACFDVRFGTGEGGAR